MPTAPEQKEVFVMKDINSLSHSKWRCQYHIVFAPKYRRQVIYQEIKADIGQILRKLCEQKGKIVNKRIDEKDFIVRFR